MRKIDYYFVKSILLCRNVKRIESIIRAERQAVAVYHVCHVVISPALLVQPASLSLSHSPQFTMADLGDLSEVNTRLRSIISTLRQRTERVKTVVQQPPTPPELSEEEGEQAEWSTLIGQDPSKYCALIG